jgi:hypothetical protein
MDVPLRNIKVFALILPILFGCRQEGVPECHMFFAPGGAVFRRGKIDKENGNPEKGGTVLFACA